MNNADRLAEEIAALRRRVAELETRERIRAIATGTGGAAGRVAVWDGANSIGGNANLTFADGANTDLNLRVARFRSSDVTLSIRQEAATTATIDIDPIPANGTSNAQFRFFRSTNTSGNSEFLIFRGNNTANLNARIVGRGGNTYLCNEEGDLGVGTNAPAYKLDVSGDINARTGQVYRLAGTQVVAARRTGWAAATGTATRTAFATSTVTTAQLAERVKALLDDLIAHGLLGS
jgi:hypothetical protein